MKLSDHAENIRQLIDKAFRNRLGRMGISDTISQPIATIPADYQADRTRIEGILNVLIAETGKVKGGYEKLVEELSFTLFNRISALKVMEAHTLHPEIITRRSQHGDRSFAHRHWLEQNPDGRTAEQEGLIGFLKDQLAALSFDIPLFSLEHPYHLLPTAIELNSIISAFNQIDTDNQVETDIWQSDDVLGWLYESYNNAKKAAHKASGDKTEYNKVSIQSQVYTPRWVVKFLVDNSLGKLYLEMYPDSEIKEKYKIANAPSTRTREVKPLTEIRLIDPATGSGNFLLYAFDLFYDLYQDQIDNYGADYNENKIPELIIKHNLHGVDLDDRAIQLAQLGLYIKAKRKKRSTKIEHFNIVSSDFFLPDYSEVKHLFEENGQPLNGELEKIVMDLWSDLQQAYKFGSLIRLEEKLSAHLHDLTKQWQGSQLNLFTEPSLATYENFRVNFFANLQKAVEQNTAQQGVNFLNTKTQDAITFLQLLTQKYYIAVANPPYTDGSDFGPELKTFIEDNYKKPYKFNTNLYATFIKRCYELTDETGYVALIHPHTFMFIKTFEEVRKFMIEKTHIDLMVDYGLDRVNLFGTGILLDATWYVLCKTKKDVPGLYFNITANQQEKHKKASLERAYDDVINNRKNERAYTLDQSKLKIIEGWPFIYWISDGFREKFGHLNFANISDITNGVKTGDNERLLRFFWEINSNYLIDNSHWFKYAKGGPFNKWFGNIWLVINYKNNGAEIMKSKNFNLLSKDFAFRQGITYSDATSKGVAFRFLDKDVLFDMSGPGILPKDISDLGYAIALLNTNLVSYIASCLNSTVHTQIGDIKRIPYVKPTEEFEKYISNLAAQNIEIKKHLCSYHIIETNFNKTPISAYTESTLKDRLFSYLNYENAQLTRVLLNEAIINELIFEVYDLSPEDRLQVETKMGKPVGQLPVLAEARAAYLEIFHHEEHREHEENNELKKLRDLRDLRGKEFINNLEITTVEDQQIQAIKAEFATLYQNNNDLEEFCIRHQINPINIWYWFKEANVLPSARAAEIALEFLADAIRTILADDDDGIIPLVGQLGEPRLLDRLEKHCLDNGFTSAQFMQMDGLLGKPLNDYLEHNFFNDLSNHLNLFMYLPKTPFIWHLSSGENQGLEVYISIYKWSRDNLFRLKTAYISKRIENLEYRQIQLKDSETAQAQSEKEKISLQLREIAEFTKKIEELIAEGYDPKLDDGVGKNIAPLQKKGLLRCDVLNAKQLDKYLKADW
ncbi:MAG: BREX-1 system adenine-specific DNA-methyltransferase PglX [Candidatus Margulisiibacteriota bacterium]|nr:MAG: BREX-1 system adenine-specific DNA-methyltransferase PglX [Candidatus Margulisiibacteriota bacterium]